jgi:flagellar motility protein MotE (MotC chaperone)
MAENEVATTEDPEARKKEAARIKEEKKQLKAQAKELKKQRKALEAEEADADEEGGALSVILVTIVIILIWLAILALLIKMDVGGFGSNILAPILKDVPVINKVLPEGSAAISDADSLSGDNVIDGGYKNLDDAVARIKVLETELAEKDQDIKAASDTIDELTQEVARLKTYEDNQVEFEKIKDEFDNEVVFNDNAPDITEYLKYYEQIDPTNAEILYKEVLRKEEASKEVKDYAKAYSQMKPKDAATIFNSDPLRSDLELAAKILGTMNADARGQILAEIGKLDDDLAGNITEIMEPDEE